MASPFRCSTRSSRRTAATYRASTRTAELRAELVGVLMDLRERFDDVLDALAPGSERVLHEVDRLAQARGFGDGERHLRGVEAVGELHRDGKPRQRGLEEVVPAHRRILHLA